MKAAIQNKKIYWLTVEDVQTVAQDKLGRDLIISEIKQLEDLIAGRIDWHEAISGAIDQQFPDERDAWDGGEDV